MVVNAEGLNISFIASLLYAFYTFTCTHYYTLTGNIAIIPPWDASRTTEQPFRPKARLG